MPRRYHEPAVDAAYAKPKEATTLDHFIKGLGPSVKDAVVVVFACATVCTWIWSAVTTMALGFRGLQGHDMSWFATPSYWAPLGYSLLWLIGAGCEAIIKRGKHIHAAEQE